MKTKTLFTIFLILSSTALFVLIAKNYSKDDSIIDLELIDYKLIDFENIEESFSNIYSELEYIYLEKKDILNIETISDVKIQNDLIFILSDIMREPKLIIYNRAGSFKSVAFLKDLDISPLPHFAIDPENNKIFLADKDGKTLSILDYKGNPISKKKLSFNFVSFDYNSDDKSFYFFSIIPRQLIHKNYELNVSILNETFDFINEYSFDSSNKELNNIPYQSSQSDYCYSKAGQFFHSYQENAIYQLFQEENKLMVKNTNANINRSAVDKFFVTKEFIYLRKKIFNRNYSIIMSKRNNKAYLIQNAMPIENYGNSFDFVYNTPEYISDNSFVSVIDNKLIDLVANNLEQDKKVRQLQKAEIVLMLHNYNHHFLEENSSNDLSSIILNNTLQKLTKGTIKVFPNSTKSRINISLKDINENIIGSEFIIRVYSINGIEIQQKYKTDKKELIELELDTIPGNFCIVSVYNEKGEIIDQQKVFVEK